MGFWVCSNCQSSCVKHIITDIEIHCKLWIPHFFPWSIESRGSWTLQFSTIVGCKLEQIIWNVISAGCKLWTTEAVVFTVLGLVKTTLCPGDLWVQTQFYPIWRVYFIQSMVYKPRYSCKWICSYIWQVSSTTSSSSKGWLLPALQICKYQSNAKSVSYQYQQVNWSQLQFWNLKFCSNIYNLESWLETSRSAFQLLQNPDVQKG
jgi:hypothetical protein